MDRRGKTARDWSAIEAEAARLYLEAQQSGDWDSAYDWVERDPAHGYAFAKAEASWELSGRVGVADRGHRKAVVSAGNYAVVSGGTVGVSRLSTAQMARRTAWSEGVITFDGETLEQAVTELNRYRSKPLVIGSPEIASLRVGGTVHTADSDTFIRSLSSAFGLRAVPGKDSVLIMPGDAPSFAGVPAEGT